MAAPIVNRLESDPAWRTEQLRHDIERTYAPVLPLFHFSPEVESQLKTLLVQRREVPFLLRPARDETPSSRAARQAAIKDAQAKVDGAIRTLVGDSVYPQIAELVAAESTLSSLSLNDAKELAERGCPLTAEQHRQLALALSAAFDPSFNPAAFQRGKLPLDAQDLTELDRQVIAQLRGVLSSPQLLVLQRRLYEGNHRVRGLPINWTGEDRIPADAAQLIGRAIAEKGGFGSVHVGLFGSGRARSTEPDFINFERTYTAIPYEAYPSTPTGEHLLMCIMGVALFDEQGQFVRNTSEQNLRWLDGKPHAQSPFDAH